MEKFKSAAGGFEYTLFSISCRVKCHYRTRVCTGVNKKAGTAAFDINESRLGIMSLFIAVETFSPPPAAFFTTALPPPQALDDVRCGQEKKRAIHFLRFLLFSARLEMDSTLFPNVLHFHSSFSSVAKFIYKRFPRTGEKQF